MQRLILLAFCLCLCMRVVIYFCLLVCLFVCCMKSAVVLAQATKSENVQSFSTDVKREVQYCIHACGRAGRQGWIMYIIMHLCI